MRGLLANKPIARVLNAGFTNSADIDPRVRGDDGNTCTPIHCASANNASPGRLPIGVI